MSLFAAYAPQAQELEEKREQAEKPDWLTNSSFQVKPVQLKFSQDQKTSLETQTSKNFIKKHFETSPNTTGHAQTSEDLHNDSDIECFQVLSEASCSGTEKKPKKRKKKNKKHRKHEKKEDHGTKIDEPFCIDTKRITEYLSVNTISRPAVPKYRTRFYLQKTEKANWKKNKIKRYFKLILDQDDKQQIITKENLDKLDVSERDEDSPSIREEQNIKNRTEFFNKTLAEQSNDVKLWLEYVNFQDIVYNHEKNYKKGSIAKAQRVLAERKIAILEKALFHNPDDESLLRERIKVAVSGYSIDELQQQMKRLVEKDQGNIILWQGYIEASQCSMAHCNTSSVTTLYSNCLSTLHKLRRSTLLEKYLLEENILKMLYQCGLFFKQAGLFENLWTLLCMYLEMNLSPADKTKFDIEVNFDERQFQELEEEVFTSQLPLHEVWLRIEKLRESCHFLPVKDHQKCSDPQRIVFSDDVVDLIHPITMPENIFKLVATTLSLLKIPLLPNRHTTTQALGLDYVPWNLDSIESLLAVFFPLYPVDTTCSNMLTNTNRLSVGPQYLRNVPGQEEYLTLILTVFEHCADCLSAHRDKMALRVWWLRFQRLLIVLEKQGRFYMPQFLKRKIKSGVKNFLKREENRNQAIFYLEYALIEKEITGVEKCLDVLNIALKLNKNTPLKATNDDDEQAIKCLLQRLLIENVLGQENVANSRKKETTLENLTSFMLQRKVDKITQGLLMEADTKFKVFCGDLLQNFHGKKNLVEHYLPNFFTDFHICYGWFLFFYKGPLECGMFLEESLNNLEKYEECAHFECEILYEFYCMVLFKHCTEHYASGIFKILDHVLIRAVEKFPNNLFLLALLAKEQSLVKSFGPQWWKVEKILLKSERAFSTVFTVVIYDLIRQQLMENTTDTITGSQFQTSVSYKNKMLSLFKKITENNKCTRRCGLIWRIYLQFVDTYFSPELCRKIYYSAVEECPWLKALYIDAAIYIPAELNQIQDLIIEKQLRLHVTPEELEILRN